jgi:hypothetical protein
MLSRTLTINPIRDFSQPHQMVPRLAALWLMNW